MFAGAGGAFEKGVGPAADGCGLPPPAMRSVVSVGVSLVVGLRISGMWLYTSLASVVIDNYQGFVTTFTSVAVSGALAGSRP